MRLDHNLPADFFVLEWQAKIVLGLLFLIAIHSLAVWLLVAARLVGRQPLVPYEPRRRVPWAGVDVLIVVATIVLLQTASLAILMSWFAVDVAALSHPDTHLQVIVLIDNTIVSIVLLAIAVAILNGRAGATAADLGFDIGKLGRDIRLGCVTFLAAVVPVLAIQLILTHWFPSRHPIQTLVTGQPQSWILALASVSAVVVAPVFEELVFRVLLQGWIEAREGQWRREYRWLNRLPRGAAPILASSLAFASLHNWPDMAALFVLALFLGYLYRQTHRIFAPLTVHICLNALSMLELWATVGAPAN
jgi:membrane protease YdiL (CAAX protease family)